MTNFSKCFKTIRWSRSHAISRLDGRRGTQTYHDEEHRHAHTHVNIHTYTSLSVLFPGILQLPRVLRFHEFPAPIYSIHVHEATTHHSNVEALHLLLILGLSPSTALLYTRKDPFLLTIRGWLVYDVWSHLENGRDRLLTEKSCEQQILFSDSSPRFSVCGDLVRKALPRRGHAQKHKSTQAHHYPT